jgi:hypothetical protein
MKQKKTPYPGEEVIEEIRAVRRKLWNDGGGTLEGYLRVIKDRAERIEKERRAKSKSTRPRKARRAEGQAKAAPRQPVK